MKTTPLLAALAAFLLAAPSASFAQASGSFSFGKPKAAAPADLVTVQAKGQGESVEAAKKDAVRNAIKQAVGELVDAKTLVENDELVEDKILTLSNAMVEKADYGEAKRSADGLFEVPVTAVVKKGRLNQELKAVGIATGAVKGDSLAAELFSGKERVANAEKFFAERFKDFPQNVMEAEVLKKEDGSPDINVNSTTGEVSVNCCVRVNLENYAAFAQALQELLGSVCTEQEKTKISFKTHYNDGTMVASDFLRKNLSVVVATPKKPHRSAWDGVVYYLDDTMYKTLADVIKNQFPKWGSVEVVLNDKDGESVCSRKVALFQEGAESNVFVRFEGFLPIAIKYGYYSLFIAPYLGIVCPELGKIARPKDSMRSFSISLGKVAEEDLGDVAGYEIKLDFAAPKNGGED